MRKIALILSIILCISSISCKNKENTEEVVVEDEGCEMLILASSTPGSILTPMLEYHNEDMKNSYTVAVSTAADNMMLSANGDYDLVSLPLNMAYYLYERTEGGCSIIGITATGNISLIGINTECDDIYGLEGKSVYVIGDTVPEYIFRYLIDKKGIDVELNTLSSYTELIECIGQGGEFIAVCEEPYVSHLASKYELSNICDINELWKNETSFVNDIPTEVLVVNNKFANANQKAVENISEEYCSILTEYSENLDYIVDSGVTEGIEISTENIENSDPVYIYGEEMITLLKDFSLIMQEYDPEFTTEAFSDKVFYK